MMMIDNQAIPQDMRNSPIEANLQSTVSVLRMFLLKSSKIQKEKINVMMT
jgi:hypothetical protein